MKTFLTATLLLLLAVAGPTGSDKVADPKAPSVKPQRAHAAGMEKRTRSIPDDTDMTLILGLAGVIVFGCWLLDFKDRLENPQRRVVR